MKEINHLDLFSGIGGFHMGFERAGFKINSYFSEVDKHAIAVYKHQFPNSTYVGSVTNVRGRDLPKIDLITFGSPCQDFSLAGKRAGMEGERSSLILEAVRLIHECRPSVFVWENVKGTFSSNDGADFWAIIQTFANIGGYRLEWQLLNTSWFLPQNRERIYLVGYSSAPERGWRGVFPIARETQEPNGIRVRGQLPGGQLGRVLDTEGNGYALSACDYKDPMKVVVGAYRGRYNADGTTSQQLEVNENGTTNTLTAVQKDNMVITPGTWRTHKDGQGFRAVQGDDAPTIPARAREDGSGQPVVKVENQISRIAHLGTGGQKGFVHSTDGISPCINATEYTDPMKVAVKSEARPVQIGQSDKTFAAQNGTLIGKEGQDAFTIRAANPNGVMVEHNESAIGVFGNNKETQHYKEVEIALALKASNQTNPRSGGTTLIKVKESKGINKVTYGKHQQDCYYNTDGDMGSIPAGTHGSTPHLLKIKVEEEPKMKFIGAVSETKWLEDGKHLSRNYSQGNRVYAEDGIAPTLSSQMGGQSNGGGLVGIKHDEEPNYTIGDLRYDEGGFRPRNNGIAPSVVGSSKNSGTPNCSMLLDNTNFRIRRLTPIETERLQGFPDNHTAYGNYDGEVKIMSNTQRYKQCGNAVTVDVVQAVAERCYDLF